MKPWLTYVKERFPLPVYLLLAGGFAFSSAYLYPATVTITQISVTLIGLLLFFFELRLMDEYKDYNKDLVIHPERPLPRGLFSVAKIKQSILFIQIILLLYGVFLGVAFNFYAGLFYFISAIHLWLMFKEFYIGEKLQDYPFIYAVTHQAVLIWISIFGIFITNPDILQDPRIYQLALLNTGAFFSYEMCRKLDPNSAPLAKTYLQAYGPLKTVLLVLLVLSMAIYGGFALGISKLTLPIQIFFSLTLLIPLFKPAKFKITEHAGEVLLLTHLWAIPIAYKLGVHG